MDAIRAPDQLGTLESHAGRASFDRIHRLCLLLGLEIMLQPKGTRSTKESTARSETEW